MRIIKRGAIPEQEVYCLTCPICESVLELAPHEARPSRDERDVGIRVVDCPVCSKSIFFDERKAKAGDTRTACRASQ